MGWFKALISLVVLALIFLWAISFRAENLQDVPLSLVFYQFEAASLSVWVTLSFIVGLLVGVVLMLPWVTKLKARLYQAQRKQSKQAD